MLPATAAAAARVCCTQHARTDAVRRPRAQHGSSWLFDQRERQAMAAITPIGIATDDGG